MKAIYLRVVSVALSGGIILTSTNAHAAVGGPVAAIGRMLVQQTPIAPVLAGTNAIRISAQRFADNWERARRDASTSPEMRVLIAPAAGLTRLKQMAFVQAAVTKTIKWRSDATQWGRHDYWASAEETLRSGYGDMEDRAIVKMAALRALGVPTRDLYFTLARDTVGGPEAVLIVRNGAELYVLDDTGGPPYTSRQRPEFHPILTFGFGASWIHAIPTAGASIAKGRSATGMSDGR